MGLPQQRDIADLVTARTMSTPLIWTAAGTGDNTTKTGTAIDRKGFGSTDIPTCAQFAVNFAATLASGATLSVSFNVLDSADNSAFAAFSSAASAVVATGPSGGGQVIGQAEFGLNLGSAREYIRCDFVPDLSAAGTDTAVAIATAVFAGFDELPAPT